VPKTLKRLISKIRHDFQLNFSKKISIILHNRVW